MSRRSESVRDPHCDAPAGSLKLRQPSGYPGMIGAMFWTIDADRRGNYNYSNIVGPQLHGYAATR